MKAVNFIEKDLFKFALFLSLLCHSVILTNVLPVHKNSPFKPLKNIEVTYQRFKVEAKPAAEIPPKEPQAERRTAVVIDKNAAASSLLKDISKLMEKIEVPPKPITKVEKIDVKRRITVPPLQSDQIKNPAYRDYYSMLRTTIKNRVYANYTGTDLGKVYLTFVVSSDGKLKAVKIIDDLTSANSFLKGICLKSIEEAAESFPPFPPDLSFQERTFNVEISFEEEK